MNPMLEYLHEQISKNYSVHKETNNKGTLLHVAPKETIDAIERVLIYGNSWIHIERISEQKIKYTVINERK